MRLGTPYNGPASEILGSWLKLKLGPISGAKELKLVGFYEHSVPRDVFFTFLKEFQHFYNLMGLGEAKLADQHSPVIPDALPSFLSNFDETGRGGDPNTFIIAFSEQPLPSTFCIPLCLHIATSVAYLGDPRVIQELCLIAYSQVRKDATLGFVQNHIAKILSKKPFAPAFILERTEQLMGPVIHMVWDPLMKLGVCTDEVGSSLICYQAAKPSSLRGVIQQIKANTPGGVCVNLIVMQRDLTSSDLQKITKHREGWKWIASISLTPSIVGQFVESGDVISFDVEGERDSEIERTTKPLASCVVMSRHHPSYILRLYKTYDDYGSPRRSLTEFAHALSSLSWLSVTPTQPHRKCGLPPHVSALLRLEHCSKEKYSALPILPDE
jgi:hypothetical protein